MSGPAHGPAPCAHLLSNAVREAGALKLLPWRPLWDTHTHVSILRRGKGSRWPWVGGGLWAQGARPSLSLSHLAEAWPGTGQVNRGRLDTLGWALPCAPQTPPAGDKQSI